MTRRSLGQTDSLDMLLDTMCNTFGGIILIALLISLLARDVPATSDRATSGARAQDLWLRYTNTLAKHGQVRSEYARAVPTLSLLEAVERLRQKATLATMADSDLRKMVREGERDVRAAEDIQRKLAAELSDLNRHIEQVTREFASVTNHRAGEIRAPRSVPAPDREYWDFVVKGGRLWPVQRLVNHQRELDRSSFTVNNFGAYVELEPIPERGIDVRRGSAEFQQLLRTGATEDHVVRFFLYPDSFPDFPALRRIAVEKGFGYDLVLCEPNSKLQTGPRGAGQARRMN